MLGIIPQFLESASANADMGVNGLCNVSLCVTWLCRLCFDLGIGRIARGTLNGGELRRLALITA
jgi:hypothetical protein